MLKCIFKSFICAFLFFSFAASHENSFLFPAEIKDEEISLCRLKENSIELATMAKSFEIEVKLLADLISSQSYIFWEMKHEGIVKGVLYIERYKDLHALSQQVLNAVLAKQLWENNISFELSYNIGQEFQGKGLGAKMVQLWTEQTKTLPWYASVFATVKSYNKNSIHLLEKYAGFKKVGHFPLREEEISVYMSAFKTFKTST